LLTNARSVVLFRVHEDKDIFRQALAKLRREVSPLDVQAVIYLKDKSDPPRTFENEYIVDHADLQTLPYEARLRGFDPDNSRNYNELPVLHFYRANPDYDVYWIVECDVHYSGSWGDLFDTLSTSRADLLTTTIADRADNPDWYHWGGLRQGDTPAPPDLCVKVFMPFARVSRAALAAIDEAYVAGWTGHPEGTWPTICRLRNLAIEDLGGDGTFTPARWKNKHYRNTLCDPYLSPGTFRFRPPVTMAEIEASSPAPLLWHPVKS
jgi:hypothetical protein